MKLPLVARLLPFAHRSHDELRMRLSSVGNDLVAAAAVLDAGRHAVRGRCHWEVAITTVVEGSSRSDRWKDRSKVLSLCHPDVESREYCPVYKTRVDYLPRWFGSFHVYEVTINVLDSSGLRAQEVAGWYGGRPNPISVNQPCGK